MHSSRMRTGRSLTVFRSLLLPGRGVYLPGPGGGCTCLVPWGCTWSGGCTCLVPGGVPAWSQGVYLPGPWGCIWSRGVPAWSGGCLPGPGGVPAWSWGCTCLVPGGCTCLVRGDTCLVWGVYLPVHGGGHLVKYSPPVNRMTHTCKNITLAKTSFRPVMKCTGLRNHPGQNGRSYPESEDS